MFNLKGPQGQNRGPLVVRAPQFEKRCCRPSVCPTYLWQTVTALVFGRLAGRTWKTSNK